MQSYLHSAYVTSFLTSQTDALHYDLSRQKEILKKKQGESDFTPLLVQRKVDYIEPIEQQNR